MTSSKSNRFPADITLTPHGESAKLDVLMSFVRITDRIRSQNILKSLIDGKVTY